MNKNKIKLDLFHKMIEEKMADDQWNVEIVNRVLKVQKDKRRKVIQFGVLPFIILSTVSILYYSSNPGSSSSLAEKNEIFDKSHHNPENQEYYPDFKLHIVDTVYLEK